MSISTLHEALLLLFRDHKRLAVDLLQDTLHVPLPRFHQIHLEPNEVGNLKPTKHRADLIFTLRDSHKKPLQAIILEVQLHISQAKRETWPLYLVNLRGRLHCEVILLVVAVSASVARWASQPIEMGHPGWVLRPLVLGPEMIPIITQFERAKRAPELAVLSAMAHGRGEHGEAIATAALGALDVLYKVDAERATLYHDLIDQHLNTAAKRALEDLMELKWQYRSNFAKKYIGIGRAEGELKGEARGRAEGEARGIAKGKAEGEARGIAKGKAEGVLAVLEARGFRVPKRIRVAVLGCTDLEQLDAWLRRAVSVEKASELLG